MENWERHLNRIWNGGKLFIIGAVVLFITFTLGTFKPNKHVVNKNKKQLITLKNLVYMHLCLNLKIQNSLLKTFKTV